MIALALKHWRLVSAAGAVLALIGGVWLIGHAIYSSGYEAAKSAIAEQDKGAVDAADKASARRRACIASGRVWSVAAGQCR